MRSSARYTYENRIKVIDLGLRIGDIDGLQREDVFDKGVRHRSFDRYTVHHCRDR
jgi:hypothetical protein